MLDSPVFLVPSSDKGIYSLIQDFHYLMWRPIQLYVSRLVFFFLKTSFSSELEYSIDKISTNRNQDFYIIYRADFL